MYPDYKFDAQAINQQGLLNGNVSWTDSEGVIYDGECRDGVPHGKMTITHPDGTRMITNWSFGTNQGHTVLEREDGYRFEGEYRQGKANGKGKSMPTGLPTKENFVRGNSTDRVFSNFRTKAVMKELLKKA